MKKTERSRYPPLTVDGYKITGVRLDTSETPLSWHICSTGIKNGVRSELVVEGETLRPAVAIVLGHGSTNVTVTGVRAVISFAERRAILAAIGHWKKIALSVDFQA